MEIHNLDMNQICAHTSELEKNSLNDVDVVYICPGLAPTTCILYWYGHCMRLSVNKVGGSGGMHPQENFKN